MVVGRILLDGVAGFSVTVLKESVSGSYDVWQVRGGTRGEFAVLLVCRDFRVSGIVI